MILNKIFLLNYAIVIIWHGNNEILFNCSNFDKDPNDAARPFTVPSNFNVEELVCRIFTDINDPDIAN